MKICGVIIILGSYCLAWYCLKGLGMEIDPAWVYFWGNVAGMIGTLMMLATE